MPEPDKRGEPAINRENKASAMRWAVGAVVVLLLGLVAWWVSDPRGEPIDPVPGHEVTTGSDGQPDGNQPPAVAPDADSSSSTLDAPPPATSGAGTQ